MEGKLKVHKVCKVESKSKTEAHHGELLFLILQSNLFFIF